MNAATRNLLAICCLLATCCHALPAVAAEQVDLAALEQTLTAHVPSERRACLQALQSRDERLLFAAYAASLPLAAPAMTEEETAGWILPAERDMVQAWPPEMRTALSTRRKAQAAADPQLAASKTATASIERMRILMGSAREACVTELATSEPSMDKVLLPFEFESIVYSQFRLHVLDKESMSEPDPPVAQPQDTPDDDIGALIRTGDAKSLLLASSKLAETPMDDDSRLELWTAWLEKVQIAGPDLTTADDLLVGFLAGLPTTSLAPRAQPTLLRIWVANEQRANRESRDAEAYTTKAGKALVEYLASIEATLDQKFNPDKVPQLNPLPPEGSAIIPGQDPAAIADPEQREAYAKIVAENHAYAAYYAEQYEVRGRVEDIARTFHCWMATVCSPEAIERIRQAADQQNLSEQTIQHLFRAEDATAFVMDEQFKRVVEHVRTYQGEYVLEYLDPTDPKRPERRVSIKEWMTREHVRVEVLGETFAGGKPQVDRKEVWIERPDRGYFYDALTSALTVSHPGQEIGGSFSMPLLPKAFFAAKLVPEGYAQPLLPHLSGSTYTTFLANEVEIDAQNGGVRVRANGDAPSNARYLMQFTSGDGPIPDVIEAYGDRITLGPDGDFVRTPSKLSVYKVTSTAEVRADAVSLRYPKQIEWQDTAGKVACLIQVTKLQVNEELDAELFTPDLSTATRIDDHTADVPSSP